MKISWGLTKLYPTKSEIGKQIIQTISLLTFLKVRIACYIYEEYKSSIPLYTPLIKFARYSFYFIFS